MKCEVIILTNNNSRDPISEAARRDPAVAKAVSQLSGQELARLREVLADPERTKQMLNSPLARQLMRRLSGGGE